MDTAPEATPRRPFRWLPPALALIALLFGLPVLLFVVFGPHWRQVQELRSRDRQHIAQLERLYGYIDVDFRVSLDGKVIHRSWDCSPDDTLPFRETLAWDESGDVLVFELAGEPVFAYDVAARSEVDPSRFKSLVIPRVTLEDIGFEGRRDLRRRMQSSSDGKQ